jgi:phosphoglucomutase
VFLHDTDRGAASPAFRVLFVFVADPYRLKRIDYRTLAGEPVDRFIDRAAGNNAPIGDVKVSTANGWLAARPSGIEDIYKIYAESFRDADHLAAILA